MTETWRGATPPHPRRDDPVREAVRASMRERPPAVLPLPRAERRRFGMRSAMACGFGLGASVVVMLTTIDPAALTAALLVAGVTGTLLTDWALGERESDLD